MGRPSLSAIQVPNLPSDPRIQDLAELCLKSLKAKRTVHKITKSLKGQARYKLHTKEAVLFCEYLQLNQTMCFLLACSKSFSPKSAKSQPPGPIRLAQQPNRPTAQQPSLKRCPVWHCFGPLTIATDLLHLCGPTTNFWRIAPAGDQWVALR